MSQRVFNNSDLTKGRYEEVFPGNFIRGYEQNKKKSYY